MSSKSIRHDRLLSLDHLRTATALDALGAGLRTACALALTCAGSDCDAAPAPALPTTIVIPQDREDYAPSYGLKIRVPAGFVRSGGKPVEQLDFFARLDLATGAVLSPDGPFREGSIPFTLSIVGHAALDSSLNPNNPEYTSGPFGVDMRQTFSQRYGLNYLEYSPAPDFPRIQAAILMFNHSKPHRLRVKCWSLDIGTRDSCRMEIMLDRGGGLNPSDRYATMISTRLERRDLPNWKTYHDALVAWRRAHVRAFKRKAA